MFCSRVCALDRERAAAKYNFNYFRLARLLTNYTRIGDVRMVLLHTTVAENILMYNICTGNTGIDWE